ncbi:MAG TPA: oligosaccharide flippase family protein [Bacteroidales bacterium]|nr:oligosaccharide flippase family protein [Bacteroidales bacterium]HPT02378.1 oligosaccharide flippase family protein [Bacteroidales bacterium]
MRRKFLTNLGLLLFLNFLVKPFWILGIDRTVQNITGPEEYGFYASLLNFTFIFNILLDFGITNFNNRNIAQNSQLLNKHFSGIVSFKLLLGILFFVVTLGVGLIIGYKPRQMQFLMILGFNQFLTSFILYLRSNISGILHFKTDSVISVLDRLIMILICSVLLWGRVTDQPFRIEWFVYAQTIAYLITAVIAFGIVVRKSAFKKLQLSIPFARMIIKQSFPYAVLVLLMASYNRIDSVMLERLLPDNGDMQAGIYASAYRLLDAVNMIAYLFSVILLPMFAKLIKEKLSVEWLVKLSFTLLFTASIIVSAGSYFYSFELMDLLYVSHVTESSNIFRLLIIGFIPIATTYIFGTLLTANGSMKALNITAFLGMIINIGLNFWLIPKYFAIGSAYASLVTQFVTGIIQIIIVQRQFKFHINKKFLITLPVYVAGVIAINIGTKSLSLAWETRFLMMMAFSLLLAIALKLFNFRSLFELIRNR